MRRRESFKLSCLLTLESAFTAILQSTNKAKSVQRCHKHTKPRICGTSARAPPGRPREIGLVFRVEKIGGEDERGHGLLRTVGLDRQKAKRREGHVLSPLRECPRRLNEPGERVRLRRQDATLAVGFPPWRGLDGAGVRQPVHRDLRLYNTYQW